MTSIITATSGLAAARTQQITKPAITLSASTVAAGGTLIATGDCAGITMNVVPSVRVYRVNGEPGPGDYDTLVEGTIKTDGTFEIPLTIPAAVPPGEFVAYTVCVFDGDQVSSGDEVRFQVTPGPATTTSTTTSTPLTATPRPTPPEAAPANSINTAPAYTG